MDISYKKLAENLLKELFSIKHNHHNHHNHHCKNEKDADFGKNFAMYSRGEMMVLTNLDTSENNFSQSDMAKNFNVSKTRVTKIIDSLEKKELVKRISIDDRRKYKISITKKGRELVNKKQTIMRDEFTEILKKMGKEDAKEFVRLCKKMIDIVSERKK